MIGHLRVKSAWSQLGLVQGAFWGRRHGFRRARSGPELDPLIAFADNLGTLLATQN